MDTVLHDFLSRLWGEVLPFLDWAVTNWAVTLVVLTLVLSWSFYRGKFRK